MPQDVTTLQSALQNIDMTQELPFSLLRGDENIVVILYKPHAQDTQTPHDQDEFYFIASGQAAIEIDGRVSQVAVGDAVFVGANVTHRFLEPSDDFSCWAIFYGPRQSTQTA